MRRARPVPQADCPEVDEVAPAFHLSFEGTWADDYPDPDAPFSLGAYVEHDLECLVQAYRDFALTLAPQACRISECDAVEYVAEYDWVDVRVPHPVPFRERAMYVNNDPAIYSVRMFDLPGWDPPLVFNFDEFMRTVRFA